MKKLAVLLAIVLIISGVYLYKKITIKHQPEDKEIFLPGTQPNVVKNFIPSAYCSGCHLTDDLKNSPYSLWQGSMMGNAARDPLFLAALAIANQDVPGAGDLCLRCHTPVGWLEGRSKPVDGSALTEDDREGLACDFCHRLVDPLTDEAKSLTGDITPKDYGNGMFVTSVESIRRGPYKITPSPHRTAYSEFHVKGNICGTCHDVTNPINKLPVERTFSEWEQSDYAKQGEKGSCQACHMKNIPGYAAKPTLGNIDLPYRKTLPTHDLTGGSNWVFDALPLLWEGLNKEALQAAKKRALQTLQSAADLRLEAKRVDGKVIAKLRIYNKTGHKLPTGYPEGRRMWINVKGFDTRGKIVFESGRYNKEEVDLEKDNQLKIYESNLGIKDKGVTLHFLLNDHIVKDNRIPPKGYKYEAFKKVGAAPVGYTYKDGQYWDDTSYETPASVVKIEVSLLYQSSSKEYLDFLKKEDKTDDWGDKVYGAWEKTGKGAPVEIAFATTQIK